MQSFLGPVGCSLPDFPPASAPAAEGSLVGTGANGSWNGANGSCRGEGASRKRKAGPQPICGVQADGEVAVGMGAPRHVRISINGASDGNKQSPPQSFK